MTTPCDLVFEGGGAKGVVFLGALQALEAQGFQPRRVLGTSAGAISAILLAAGYVSGALGDITRERTADGKPRLATFLDPPTSFSDQVVENSELTQIFGAVSIAGIVAQTVSLPSFLGDLESRFRAADDRLRRAIIRQLLRVPPFATLFSFVERGGLYEGSQVLGWIREKLDGCPKGRLGDSTLAAFREATGSDLSIVASDTTGDEMLVLNHRTAPQCPTAWAVRMSMSIPFLWQEVVWDADWGTYRGRDLTGHAVVDGGVLSNFPLGLVAATDPDTVAVMGNVAPGEARVIGLLIDETLPVPGSDADGGPVTVSGVQAAVNRLRTVQRVRRLVDTLTEAHDKQVITGHQDLVCRLPAKGYGTTEFDMSEARMNAMIAAGRNAMSDYLRRQS
jgi:predicted acylesterase/phospholipase RssA